MDSFSLSHQYTDLLKARLTKEEEAMRPLNKFNIQTLLMILL